MKGLRRQRAGFESESGAIAVLTTVLIVALLGVAAIVVDAGAVYSHRRQLQTAADAAALAGVQALPGNPAEAVTVAEAYAAENSPDSEDVAITVASTWVANDTLRATVQDPDLGLFFARFMGVDSALVNAQAVAKIGSPRTYGSGVMPFGIIASGTVEPPYGYDPGDEITLVVDEGSQSQGNWHYVDLTPYTDDANNTKTVIEGGGTTDPLSIGDIINTQTGAPNNPNYKAIDDYFGITCAPHGREELVYDDDTGLWKPVHQSDGTQCNRLITCPVIVIEQGGNPYDWDSVTGNTKVRVVGFLNMFISNDPNFKDGELNSTFVQVVPEDTMTPGGLIDYGGVVRWLDE